jgi:hypothetical protein
MMSLSLKWWQAHYPSVRYQWQQTGEQDLQSGLRNMLEVI